MATHDTASMHVYDSWTDTDLHRAIELDPACAAEYVEELRARQAGREASARLAAQHDRAYGLKTLSLWEKIQYRAEELRARLGW